MPSLPQNLVDTVADDLLEKIVDGTYIAQQRLVISSLARDLGISAIPVREALARLSGTGIVIFAPNIGYRVASQLDKQGFIELFEARLTLDLASVEGVLEFARDEDIDALKELNALIAGQQYSTHAFGEFNQFTARNIQFHRLFVELSNNRFRLQLYDHLGLEMQISRHIVHSGIEFDTLIHGHDEIIDALRARSSRDLRRVLIEHLTEGINLMFPSNNKIILQPAA